MFTVFRTGCSVNMFSELIRLVSRHSGFVNKQVVVSRRRSAQILHLALERITRIEVGRMGIYGVSLDEGHGFLASISRGIEKGNQGTLVSDIKKELYRYRKLCGGKSFSINENEIVSQSASSSNPCISVTKNDIDPPSASSTSPGSVAGSFSKFSNLNTMPRPNVYPKPVVKSIVLPLDPLGKGLHCNIVGAEIRNLKQMGARPEMVTSLTVDGALYDEGLN